MSNQVYIITECEDIIDVCSSEYHAKRAVNYWVQEAIGNYSNEEEARNNIVYSLYEMNQWGIDVNRENMLTGEYPSGAVFTDEEELKIIIKNQARKLLNERNFKNTAILVADLKLSDCKGAYTSKLILTFSDSEREEYRVDGYLTNNSVNQINFSK